MGRRKNNLWIQKAIKKPGALRRQLGVPKDKKIPKTLLERIRSAKVGTRIRNPTKTGKRSITVTRKLKRRAIVALTLREF